MSSESRRGLRIALCFTVAFVLAVGTLRLILLPIIAWLLVVLAGVAMQVLAREPVVLGLLSLWVFYHGFRMFADPRNATLGLILLLVFAIVPQTWINRETMARWRPEMQKFYYDADKYDTYLDQLGVKFPTYAK